jgi:hypothetical protein
MTMVPLFNAFFFYPQNSRVNQAGQELLQIITGGDHRAKGLRFAGPPCAVPTGGTSTISVATNTTLTYHYAAADDCGGALTNHTVVLVYDTVNRLVTRQIDGGTVLNIPSYATSGSDIRFDRFETNIDGNSSFFRYYNAAGTELTSPVTLTSIYRVDIAVEATSGTGDVKDSAGNIRLKTGVEIHRYP